MSPKMNLGFNFIQRDPMPETIRVCKEAEDAGFQWIGVVDSQLLAREFYVSYAAYVLNTSRASFIPMVSNVITRHPSVTASAMFSLYELAPGRVILGLASGDSAVYGVGYTQAKVETIRSYVKAVKGLLNGEEVTWDGKTFKAEWRHWQPPVPVKVFIASGGPKTIKMAAQVADGLIFNTGMGATAENVKYCKELVREGAREVGRTPDELELWWHFGVHLAESREAGLSRMAGMGVHFITRATMEGKQIPEEYREALRKLDEGHNVTTHAFPPNFGQMARKMGVFDFLVERMGGMIGTSEDITNAIQRLYDRGVRNLMFLCGAEDKRAVAKVLGKEVLPHFT